MKKHIQLFCLSLLFTCATLFAQKGNFSASLSYLGSNRNLAGYLPSNPDTSKPFKLLICLHGAGDNSTNYRNALVNTQGWPSIFLNTLIVCPDGGTDQSHDFYQPAGDQEIIAATLAWAKDNYPIDTNEIYLQGFSLGGRSALKYGLEHTGMFKGLLLNTPAIQGISDLNNNPVSSLMYAYENASKIPLFITVGSDDYTYAFTLAKLAEKLRDANAALYYEEVLKVAHAMAPNSLVQKSLPFFASKSIAPLEVMAYKLEAANREATQTIKATAFLQNMGDTLIREINYQLTAGAIQKNLSWTGILQPHQSIQIPIELQVPKGGYYTFTFEIKNMNGGQKDSLETNNIKSTTIEVFQEKTFGSLFEGFESDTNHWDITHSGSLLEWYIDPDVKKTGKSSIGSYNSIFLFYTQNSVESFTSPFINIAKLINKELSFDLAFNYSKYTAPYFANDTYFADTLLISISTDYGKTYTPLYKKGGKELATASAPILNATTIQESFFVPKANEWRKEIIDLSSYANANNALFKFSCISGMGGCLNIDNLSIGTKASGLIEKGLLPKFTMYPNPAKEKLFVNMTDQEETKLLIYNESANLVLTTDWTNEKTKEISLTDLSSGFYLIEVRTQRGTSFQKLIIQN